MGLDCFNMISVFIIKTQFPKTILIGSRIGTATNQSQWWLLLGILGIKLSFCVLEQRKKEPLSLESESACVNAQSCLTLCQWMDCRLPVFSVHGIFFLARILERLPFPPPGDIPHRGFEPLPLVSAELQGGFLIAGPSGKPQKSVMSVPAIFLRKAAWSCWE